jgi:hypothetical protein
MAKRKLAFYDHHRQRYADTVPLYGSPPPEADFMVGEFYREREGGGVGERGEFKIELKRLGSNDSLTPHACVFGDGLAAFRDLLAAADRAKVDLLAEVESRDAFTDRLLSLGLRDSSDHPRGRDNGTD